MPRGDNTRKTSTEEVLAVLREFGGDVSKTARKIGICRSSVRKHRKKAIEQGEPDVPGVPWNPPKGEKRPPEPADVDEEAADPRPLSGGQVHGQEIEVRPLPAKGRVATYILSSAINNSDVHEQFWQNLKALAHHYDAEILVRPILYNLNAYRKLGADTENEDAGEEEVYFDAAVKPYLSEQRIELAPGLHWAGDAENTATASSPLAGYNTFTGEASGIFGATKLEMRSVATVQSLPAKLLYTTGTVTQRNYTKTKVGRKADWHHAYCALLVEVDSDGDWFVRHLYAHEDGRFNDLGIIVDKGVVGDAVGLAALTPGDIHADKLDERVRAAVFGPGGMVDQLRPNELHCHDTHDHRKSHHVASDPFQQIQLMVEDKDCVLGEIQRDAAFYKYAARPWMKTVDVWSNHTGHLLRYIKDTDWKKDTVNAEFYLESALEMVRAIRRGEPGFNLYETVCRREGCPEEVVFLRPDQSWKVEGIECGMHGDQGPNGSRGTVRSIAQTGSKSTIGHSHSAGIFEGCWQTGVTAGELHTLDMVYNTGPSSWSRTMVALYPGGKRTMITMRGLKFRAKRPGSV